MKLIFELSSSGHGSALLPPCDVPEVKPEAALRGAPPRLPVISEAEMSRHYAALEKQTHGVCDGFYPLGSCTMKYNPAVNEQIAALEGFTDIHPLQPEESAQGCLEVLYETQKMLGEITGMDAVSMQPAAGAHGEYTGLLLFRAYHRYRNDAARTKIIVPDAAHGTNPASAAMAGFSVVSVPSNKQGGVDLEALRAAVGPDTAGLMLTNPNTLGLFDPNILEITGIVHEAGGLCYYDGANLNAIMGIARPGDMGFDCVHVNLHKTFATPHGGGGPGSGPVGCKAFLAEYLPSPVVVKNDDAYGLYNPVRSIGRVRSFCGNFLVIVKALAYILTLGGEGLTAASQSAVLNANYMMSMLAEDIDMAYQGRCMHEFVMTLQDFKNRTGVSALDVAKRLLDFGIHPPTMYFPLIVHEALMAEPTETESRKTLDEAIAVFRRVFEEARHDPQLLHDAPHTTPIGRPDEVEAARHPKLRYEP